jgi:hypothetical protein
MPPAAVEHTADEEFRSFVDELARHPDLEGLLLRLRRGHDPDGHGWCDHQPRLLLGTLPVFLPAVSRPG